MGDGWGLDRIDGRSMWNEDVGLRGVLWGVVRVFRVFVVV